MVSGPEGSGERVVNLDSENRVEISANDAEKIVTLVDNFNFNKEAKYLRIQTLLRAYIEDVNIDLARKVHNEVKTQITNQQKHRKSETHKRAGKRHTVVIQDPDFDFKGEV